MGVSCTSPTFQIRPVQDEPSVFVGLSTGPPQEADGQTTVGHNHPVDWSEANLPIILTRLLVQKQGGMMDPYKQPQPVFSPDDIILLTPGLYEAFTAAGPADWIVFAVWGSSPQSQALEVTSGGMYLQGPNLHIILSNHRERVSSETEGIEGIRHNPFRSLRDVKKGKLIFDPARFVIDARDNWLAGGYDSPSSELILDLEALLAWDHLSTPVATGKLAGTEGLTTNPTRTLSSESEVGALKEEISSLKEELSRLQNLILQQAKESARQTQPEDHPVSP